jgi:hypothetical protein
LTKNVRKESRHDPMAKVTFSDSVSKKKKDVIRNVVCSYLVW